MRWFGRNAIPKFYGRYPRLFDPHRTTSEFVVTLNDIIHPEVRKLYPGADPPEFDYQQVSESRVVMGYSSKRPLCAFGEGLLVGAGEHYGETIEIARPMCVKRGDPRCVYEVSIA